MLGRRDTPMGKSTDSAFRGQEIICCKLKCAMEEQMSRDNSRGDPRRVVGEGFLEEVTFAMAVEKIMNFIMKNSLLPPG